MVEEIRSMLYEALKNGWSVEDLSKLLTDSLDAVVNDFQENQEEEKKEELVNKLIEAVDDGLKEHNWNCNFAAAASALHLLGDYKNRSVQEIEELIHWEGVKI